jgi:hypothetical protein
MWGQKAVNPLTLFEQTPEEGLQPHALRNQDSF